MSKRWAILHADFGVFLGAKIGVAFWSKMDPICDKAVTFGTTGEAEEYVQSWEAGSDIDFTLTEVEVNDGDTFATVAQCVKAGLPEWSPALLDNGDAVQQLMLRIIRNGERLIIDAAARNSSDWCFRLGAMFMSLAYAASHRAHAIDCRDRGDCDAEELRLASFRGRMMRAEHMLSDELWQDLKKEGQPSGDRMVTLRPSDGAANDTPVDVTGVNPGDSPVKN